MMKLKEKEAQGQSIAIYLCFIENLIYNPLPETPSSATTLRNSLPTGFCQAEQKEQGAYLLIVTEGR